MGLTLPPIKLNHHGVDAFLQAQFYEVDAFPQSTLHGVDALPQFTVI